ncbi:MAG: RNase J family beta-CASP ribonuclease [Candidatus Pacebacteria bacterium]|nr:RNase J family beta-CASP ribonuclease [Candidatus Paceibacterota bacterium]
MNNENNTPNIPPSRPPQSGRPHTPGPRRSFSPRFNKTRTIAPTSTSTPGSFAPQRPLSAGTPNGHRVVLGRGARKTVPFRRPASSQFRAHPPQSSIMVKHAPLPDKHVAGTRMNIVRPDAARSIRRGPNKPVMKREGDVIPPLAADTVRIIPLGGVEEIGKNMTAIQYGDDIVVVDIGFQFKDDETPGIDFILPNTKYLEERQDKIRAVLITHGHLDHIGGIPYIMPRIGNPPVYTRLLTSVLIQKRQEEFAHIPKLDIQVVEKNSTITVGKLKVRFFAVTHTIPDAMGIIIETPFGSIVHTGDLKLDHVDGVPTAEEVGEYERAFPIVNGPAGPTNVLILMADSTNVENPGFSLPEKVVHKNLENIIKGMSGRLIIATFSSLLERLLKIVEFAELYNKKVIVEGRSLKQNIEICKHLGLLKAKKETIISVDDIDKYPPDRIVIISTGAQANDFSALVRMSQKTHAKIKLTPRDTVVLSSSVVPGNERAVQKLKDNLSRQGAKILHYRIADVHSSGHANRDETAWIHRAIKPKFFMPLHGYHYMLRAHCDIAKEANGLLESDVVVPDNGNVIEIQNGGTKLVKLKEKAPSGLVLVDGFSVGDVQDVVIRDRQALAQDGIFIIFGIMNATTGKLKKSPDIISRGFVYLRESQELLHEVRLLIRDTADASTKGMNPLNLDIVKDNVTDAVQKYLLQKTAKRPMVIPVILTI